MSVIEIPGGTATLRDKLVSERHFRVLEAAYMSAEGVISKLQYAFSAAAMEKLGFEVGATLTAAQAQKVEEATRTLTEEEQTAASKAVHLSRAESMALLELQDAAIVAFLEHWSLKAPLPNIDNVADINKELYKALADATKGLATQAMGSTVNFGATEDKVDPVTGLDFPTGASSVSDGHSETKAQSQSTSKHKTSGGNTSTQP